MKSLLKIIIIKRSKLNIIFHDFDKGHFKNLNFLDIPHREELFIINNIDIEKGIIIINALFESIFSLFVTIKSKIPIFIVGKPGCGKSLIINLTQKGMKGELSKNTFFKKFSKNYYENLFWFDVFYIRMSRKCFQKGKKLFIKT